MRRSAPSATIFYAGPDPGIDSLFLSPPLQAYVMPEFMKSGLTFVELQQLAMRRGGFLLGWYRPRLNEGADRIDYKEASVINPDNKTTEKVTFQAGDQLLILDHGMPDDVEMDHSNFCRATTINRFHTKKALDVRDSTSPRSSKAADHFV